MSDADFAAPSGDAGPEVDAIRCDGACRGLSDLDWVRVMALASAARMSVTIASTPPAGGWWVVDSKVATGRVAVHVVGDPQCAATRTMERR